MRHLIAAVIAAVSRSIGNHRKTLLSEGGNADGDERLHCIIQSQMMRIMGNWENEDNEYNEKWRK